MKFLDGWRYALVLRDEARARMHGRPSRAALEVPHFPQFEKYWQDSGAASEEEYEFWRRNVCGMACLKMILKHWQGKEHRLIELAKKAAEYKAYFPDKAQYLDGRHVIPGLFYKAFARFVKSEFGLKVLTTNWLSIPRIKWELSRGNLVMASVKTPRNKRHLVLVIGYDEDQGIIMVNDPEEENGKKELIENVFREAYNGRGYVFFARKREANNR